MRNNDTSNDATTAKRVMMEEAKSIISSAEKLDDSDIEQAIEILFKTSGKIIITGIGKSGHVGKKMAATLSSTGSPAYFLHPSEAVHGDLGIHQPRDPVIYLSNSGTTPELVYLEPVFRSREAKIIGILGNPNSPLGNSVDVCIDASVDQEADPLRIVPTASFAVASSIGDGIASCLMKRRNFSHNEYAQTHPAGQLGRNLLLKVSNVMHKPAKVACVKMETPMKEVVIKMTEFPLGAACVINDQKLVGLITDGDLRRELKEDDNILSKNAQSIMSKNPTTISPNISLGESLQIMEKREPSPISLVPVVSPEDSLFLGLIRLHDIYG